MFTFTSIEKEINKLKVDADEELMELLDSLHLQLIAPTNSRYNKEELKEMILTEYDVLDDNVIIRDSDLWVEIEDLQNAIIDLAEEQ